MPTLKKCVATVALALLGGCFTPNIEYIATMPHPPHVEPRPASNVEVLAREPADRPFVEIGVIVPLYYGTADDQARKVALLRERAALRGCHAIIVKDLDRAACLAYTGAPATTTASATRPPAAAVTAASASSQSSVPTPPVQRKEAGAR